MGNEASLDAVESNPDPSVIQHVTGARATNQINHLEVNLDIQISAHPLCKMLIFYEPKRIALRNTQHLWTAKKMGMVQHVSKN